jgi:hypothetical protein
VNNQSENKQQMDDHIKEESNLFDGAFHTILKSKGLTLLVSFSAVLSSIIPIFLELDSAGVKVITERPTFYSFLLIGASVAILFMILTLIIQFIMHKTKQTVFIRKEVANAFTSALDKSSFNPRLDRRILDDRQLTGDPSR